MGTGKGLRLLFMTLVLPIHFESVCLLEALDLGLWALLPCCTPVGGVGKGPWGLAGLG